MSHDGDINGSFVEEENKINIGATFVNLGCVKNELIDDCHTKQYRITLEYENTFGEPSHERKIKEDYDSLIGFQDNYVIMENATIKLETIKEDDDGTFNNFYCSKCKGIYNGYCLKCSTLLCILNNNWAVVKSESNSIPSDILEIRETSKGNRVYLLRALPINVIFGPFEGISGIESTFGHSWKIIDNKLRDIQSGNWMKNIVCAASASLRNLDIFQIDGNLYFQTNREIAEGEELLVYYDDEELQQFDNSEEFLYTPQKQEKLPNIFACIMCCLGFGSSKCLKEHKMNCCQLEDSKSMKDFVLVECHYCKMWLEKWEHEEYHVTYCLEKYHRTKSDYSDGFDQSGTRVEEMADDCDTKDVKRTYQLDMWSRPYDRSNDSQFHAKDYQCFSAGNNETCSNESREHSSNEQIQNVIETDNISDFQKHLNKHTGIKLFQCDICMIKFTRQYNVTRHIKQKHRNYENAIEGRDIKQFQCDICRAKFTQISNLNLHIKIKHRTDASLKDYKCLECAYQTNYKGDLQKHLNRHRDIKQFQCYICMMKFTQKSDLARHIKNRHTDDASPRDYKCLECSYVTNYRNSFQMHQNKHRGIKPFKCDICMMQFTRNYSLTRHLKQNHTNYGSAIEGTGIIKQFQCDICQAKFTQIGNLNVHIKNKHRADASCKDYKCLECAYETNNKGDLQKHLNGHRGIKQFQCDICMTKFMYKTDLSRHIKNKHTDAGAAKNHKCLECSYRTNRKIDLQKHLNKHRGIKPFGCDICMMKFGYKTQLKLHIKNKHTDDGSAKDYNCSECSYATNYRNSFQLHLNKHKGVKPFTCDICMMTFSQKGNLNKHIKHKHADNGSCILNK